MLDQVLELFRIPISYDLDIMEDNQTLSGITARMIEKFDPLVRKEKPDWILIQGDTTTFVILTEPEGGLRRKRVLEKEV